MIEDGYENKENELKTISERDEKSMQYDEKSYTTPHETDKTDFVTVDDTLVSNEDTYNGKGSELRLHQTDHTLDSVSFSSLPSDSQILEGHSKSNLLDDHPFQEKIEECEETDKSLRPRVETTDNLKENEKETASVELENQEQKKIGIIGKTTDNQQDRKAGKLEKERKEKEEKELK